MLAIRASGQVVHGVIHDAGGAPLGGAQVVAHSSLENNDRAVVSAADGSFIMDDLKPGHYQFKATKAGFVDSQVVEKGLTAGQDLALTLSLHAEGFLKRLSQAYAKDWKGSDDS